MSTTRVNDESELILYDIDNLDHICWSPNTFKPRAVLAYKKIPYRCQWISYPDIDSQFRQHGQQDKDVVMLPVIKDGDKYVSDSWDIARYLEEKVPQPTIFAGGVEAQDHFRRFVASEIAKIVGPWIFHQVPVILDERGAEYFTRTREARFNGPLVNISKPDDELFPALRGALTPVFHALRQSGAYIMGQEFSMADIHVLGVLQWILRADKQKFDKVIALDAEGNLAAWWERCGQYMKQMD